MIGPWYLPLFVRELGGVDVDYIVLRTTIEDALERVAVRNAPEMEDIVRKMHEPFLDLGPHERNVVETHARTIDDIMAEIARRQTSGEFRLT